MIRKRSLEELTKQIALPTCLSFYQQMDQKQAEQLPLLPPILHLHLVKLEQATKRINDSNSNNNGTGSSQTTTFFFLFSFSSSGSSSSSFLFNFPPPLLMWAHVHEEQKW